MDFNKKEKGFQMGPQKDHLGEIIERLKVLIDLLSDADFRTKYPEFVEKHNMIIEQAIQIQNLGNTELEDYSNYNSIKQGLQSLLDNALDIRENTPPDDWDKVDRVIEIIKKALNAFNN